MNGASLKLVRGIFAALIVGALGLGVDQAAAAPGSSAIRGCGPAAQKACSDACKASGYAGGSCIIQTKQCTCW